jgi:flagellar motor switch protein FliG
MGDQAEQTPDAASVDAQEEGDFYGLWDEVLDDEIGPEIIATVRDYLNRKQKTEALIYLERKLGNEFIGRLA